MKFTGRSSASQPASHPGMHNWSIMEMHFRNLILDTFPSTTGGWWRSSPDNTDDVPHHPVWKSSSWTTAIEMSIGIVGD